MILYGIVDIEPSKLFFLEQVRTSTTFISSLLKHHRHKTCSLSLTEFPEQDGRIKFEEAGMCGEVALCGPKWVFSLFGLLIK